MTTVAVAKRRALSFTLALLCLVPVLMYLQLLVMAANPTSSVGNWPSVIVQGVVAALFLFTAVLALAHATRAAVYCSFLAAVASVAVVAWIWAGSGVVLTSGIVIWLLVDCVVVIVASILGRQNGVWSLRHAA